MKSYMITTQIGTLSTFTEYFCNFRANLAFLDTGHVKIIFKITKHFNLIEDILLKLCKFFKLLLFVIILYN